MLGWGTQQAGPPPAPRLRRRMQPEDWASDPVSNLAPLLSGTSGGLLSAEPKKNQDRLIDAFHVFGVEMADAVPQFIFRHCRDLIDHKSRKSIKAVAFIGRNQNAEQRRFSWIEVTAQTIMDSVASKRSSCNRPQVAACPRNPCHRQSSISLHASISHPVQ